MVSMSLVGVKPSPLQPQCPSLRVGRRARGVIRIRCGIAEPSGEPAPLGQKTRYNDGIFERSFMSLFARKMEKYADPGGGGGKGREKKGWWEWGYDYESFVDVSRRVMQRRSRIQQQQVVREVLLSMLPPGAPAQ
ncbi:unnamed protein product, partial [Sphenostylis stenocarpa]